jgi:hypothetical protein
MQPSHISAGVDLVAVALACGFKGARTVSVLGEAEDVRALLHGGKGSILVNARIRAENPSRVLPLRDGHAIKHRFVAALGSA